MAAVRRRSRPDDAAPGARHRPGRRALHRIRRHRRPLAAVLLATAAGVTVQSVQADPPAGSAVLVAAHDLPAGRTLVAGDLTSVLLPATAAPDGALEAHEVIGRELSSPARRNEPLTDARLVGRGQLVAAPAGSVALPVPVSDDAVLSLVRPGDTVQVIAGSSAGDGLDPAGVDEARVLVQRAVVLAVPDDGGPGLLDAGGDRGGLVLAMSTDDAVKIADALERRYLAVALLP